MLAIVRHYESRVTGDDACGNGALELHRAGKSGAAPRREGCPRLRETAAGLAGAGSAGGGTGLSVPRNVIQSELNQSELPLTFIYPLARPFSPSRRYAAARVSAPYTMDMRIAAPCALLALATFSIPATAQDSAAPARPKYVSLIGTVEKVDEAGKAFSIKPDKAAEADVRFDDKTQFLRLPAGVLDTKQATRATAADVGVGDRAIARLRAEAPAGQPAVFFYFSKASDLAQRRKKTSEEWQTQGVSGIVKSVDAAAKQAAISVQGGFGPPKDMTLDLSGPVDYQHFSLDTGKYEPGGAAASIRVGDQVRVLGQKNADQTEIKVENIASGSFKTISIQVKSIDAGAGQILATDLASKKPIAIAIKPDTRIKKLDDATALLLARRLNPSFQSGRGEGRGEGRGAPGGAAPVGIPGAIGQGRGGRGGRGLDPARLLDEQPTIALADLKPGDPVIVRGEPSEDMSKITATMVVAGVDPILRAAPPDGPDPRAGNWNQGGDEGGSPQ